MLCVKYLGLTIGQDLKWKNHVNNFSANKMLTFLHRNLNVSATSINEQTYKSLVRPSLEYACYAWYPYSKDEMVQHRDTSFVTNRQGNMSCVDDLLQHLNWRSLEDRRKDAWLVMIYKIANENVAITKLDRRKTPLRDNHETCTSCLSFSLIWYRLRQPLVLSGTVETFKAAVSLIKY